MSSEVHSTHDEHRDDFGAKLGMWMFIFTEILLFGGLFLVYATYRYKFSAEFHGASTHLNVFMGALNTIILLVSSMTAAMSITSIQKKDKKLTLILIGITLFCAAIFMVNKYFEWGAKFEHGLIPGSELMLSLKPGTILFFSLYYLMTGLHGIHIIVGIILLTICFFKVKNGSVNDTDFVWLENSALYWHLVDLIWIFLFPLLYLIS